MQAQCNKLASNIKTNVQYAIDPDATAEWVSWATNDDWNTATAWNEIITYPYAIPQASGISDAGWGTDETGGWSQKRSFTYGIASPSSTSDWSAWGGTTGSWTFTSSGGTSSDASLVVCAINLWDQPNVYALKTTNWNAYCYNGVKTNGAFSGIVSYPALKRCFVTLGSLITTRDQADFEDSLGHGSLYGRVITNITMLDDDDDYDLTEAMGALNLENEDEISHPLVDMLGKL